MKNYTILLLSIVLFCSCNKEQHRFNIRGFAQGTSYQISYLAEKDIVSKNDIDSLLNDFDNSCSIYNSNSLLSKINRGECNIMDNNIKTCIDIALNVSNQSDGAYDITVKPLIEAYGFAAKEKDAKPNIDSIMQFVGYKKIKISGDTITIPKGVQIDLNSIAQGYSSDVVANYFDSKGIENYLVEIGGEIYAKGVNDKGNSWSIGIDKPIDGNYIPGNELQTIITIHNEGLATSGNYRKFYTNSNGERINHTVDPKTGKPVSHNLLSATIIAKSSAIADAYATLMIASGTDNAIKFLEQHPEIKGYIIYHQDGEDKVYITQNLKSQILE